MSEYKIGYVIIRGSFVQAEMFFLSAFDSLVAYSCESNWRHTKREMNGMEWNEKRMMQIKRCT